jgi:hypothetical protein
MAITHVRLILTVDGDERGLHDRFVRISIVTGKPKSLQRVTIRQNEEYVEESWNCGPTYRIARGEKKASKVKKIGGGGS